MIRASEIDLKNTEKRNCLNEAVAISGLPEEVVNAYFDSMYRDMKASTNDKITWCNVLNIFKKNICVVQNPVSDMSYQGMLKSIQNNPDIISNLKKICVICESLSGHNLTKDTELDSDYRDMFINADVINADVINESALDKNMPVLCSISDTDAETIGIEKQKEVFDTLKEVLAYNHKYLAFVPGVKNSYNVIKEFIDNQINNVLNDKYVTQKDEEEANKFIKELYQNEHIPPHYASIDYLRTFISDFTYLLMYIIHNNNLYIEYLGSKFKDFVNTENLINYTRIRDIIMNDFNIETRPKDDICCEITSHPSIINIEHTIKSVLGTLNIINNIRGEFSLGIRKMLNSYITQTTNLVISYKNAYLRINKYQSY